MKLALLLFCTTAFAIFSANAESKTGKESVARLRTILLYGTNDDLTKVVPEAKPAKKEHGTRMELLKDLNFKNYGLLGSEVKPIWRSYTNWSTPMKGSDQIMVSFEPHSEAKPDEVKLDLELWQKDVKVMKTTLPLKKGKWVYIAGPKWRGGRLIVGIELLPLEL